MRLNVIAESGKVRLAVDANNAISEVAGSSSAFVELAVAGVKSLHIKFAIIEVTSASLLHVQAISNILSFHWSYKPRTYSYGVLEVVVVSIGQ